MRLSLGVWLNGSTIYGGSVPPVPVLYATISPGNPVAGQLVTITFSAAPDSVTVKLDGVDLTVSGTGTTRTVTPATAGALTITATKDGYTGYSGGVTVSAEPGEDDFDLEYESDGTLTLVGVTEDGGILTITFSGSPDYSGTYTVPVAAYANGPVFLQGPRISGSPLDGKTLTGHQGLISRDANASGYHVAYQWLRDGEPIAGATTNNYLVSNATDAGTMISFRVTATDSNGPCIAFSSEVEVAGSTTIATFIAPNGTKVREFTDQKGATWKMNRYADHAIYGNRLRSATGVNGCYACWRDEEHSSNQQARVWLRLPTLVEYQQSQTDGVSLDTFFRIRRSGPAVRVRTTQDPSGHLAERQHFVLGLEVDGSNLRWRFRHIVSGGSNNTVDQVQLWQSPAFPLTDLPLGEVIVIDLKVVDQTFTGYVDGEELFTFTNPDPVNAPYRTDGVPGISGHNAYSTAHRETDTMGIEEYDGWSL